MIRVNGLTKDFGARRAIDDISFNAEKGEILGFLGPNGAGKTTTMRILTGFMPPTTGKAEVCGFDVVDQSLEVRKRVGYLPESVPLYNDMTIFEYLQYMADLRGVKDSADRVDDVLEMVQLSDRAEGYVANLSKGMRQRLGLAQALVHKPEVLILDEPTIGLDPAQIIEVRKIIRDIGKEHTVMLSTHILTEAQQICDRVLIINRGRIVAEDSPENLQNRLAGSQRIRVQVKGEVADLATKVSKIAGVSSVQTIGEDSLEFATDSGKDPRAEVARLVVKSGYDLLQLQPASLSLEEIFLQLTHDDPGAPTMGAESKDNSEDER